ncbi:MAG: hypothetical protein Q7I99_04955 [Acholeplasmataceae bacterium]|nr:hypothetical protein [Acholeplasmataceae bacterium]
MTVSDILSSSYLLLTNQNTLSNTFEGIYQTDLLSAAIKSAKPNQGLVTLISHVNTVALAMMIDLSLIIIAENRLISKEMIDKANEEGICILQTALKSFEVVIDLYQRGFL